jgi:hypothetical protein
MIGIKGGKSAPAWSPGTAPGSKKSAFMNCKALFCDGHHSASAQMRLYSGASPLIRRSPMARIVRRVSRWFFFRRDKSRSSAMEFSAFGL